MKTIIVAAGYATRLYPLTENFPKPLLKIGDNTILGRLLDDVDRIDGLSGHVIVANHKFAAAFEEWRATTHYRKPITIVDDGTLTNDTRLGAVNDLLLAIDRCGIDEDIMVLAADNILEFSLQGFVDFFKEKDSSVIMCHYEPSIERLQRTGVITVDADMRVIEMQEKPRVPVSHWAVPPFYIYRKEDLPLIRDSINCGCGCDAPGNLAHYLVDKTTVHAWQMPGRRVDIGSLDSLQEARERYEVQKKG